MVSGISQETLGCPVPKILFQRMAIAKVYEPQCYTIREKSPFGAL